MGGFAALRNEPNPGFRRFGKNEPNRLLNAPAPAALGEFENTKPMGRFRRAAQRTQSCGRRPSGKNEPNRLLNARASAVIGEFENTNPTGGSVREVFDCGPLLACWAIPADKNWVAQARLGFQITLGRCFEHLAARKNRRIPRKYFRGKIEPLWRTGAVPQRGRHQQNATAESWFENSVRRGWAGAHQQNKTRKRLAFQPIRTINNSARLVMGFDGGKSAR
jgi:hypothetical protein